MAMIGVLLKDVRVRTAVKLPAPKRALLQFLLIKRKWQG